ncbi:hypothetical protein Leryth_023987 [Lithospermum erythrorhizon]|nr:hypothetical protein Leryth_023987 [Lithospermum erythrorhizon]
MAEITGTIYALIVATIGRAARNQLSIILVKTAVDSCKQLDYNGVVVLESICLSVTIFMAILYATRRRKNIYLVDFACYKPDSSLMMTKEEGYSKVSRFFGEEAGSFHKKVLERSGVGDAAYFPDSCNVLPPKFRFNESRKEVEMVVFGAVEELLAKTCVRARDIGILIVNSSTFNPTPSISAAIVNCFKFGEDVLTYNLGGMGCSAGLISIDLANRLLREQPNSYALVVSTESITQNCYSGKVKSMMLTNCLFRIGGSAVLLSNRPSDRRRSKYRLNYLVRTHKGSDDTAYKCVYQEQDEDENIGIALSRDLTNIAGHALKSNVMRLGPLVLPISEKILYLANFIAKRVLKMKMKAYTPDFKRAFDHFCIHAGGRAVIDGLEKSLGLTEYHIEPSRMTLYRFGNTSSSSVWYELAYSEAKGRIKKNDRIWQIAFGSGFKCNSTVWIALRTIKPLKGQNPWMDEIDDLPVHVPKEIPIESDGLNA